MKPRWKNVEIILHQRWNKVVQRWRWKFIVRFCFVFNVGWTLLERWSTRLKQRWFNVIKSIGVHQVLSPGKVGLPVQDWGSDTPPCLLSFLKKMLFLSLTPVRQKNLPTCMFLNELLLKRHQREIPAVNYMFKVNNRNTRKRCEICSKLIFLTPLAVVHRCWTV